MKSKIPVVGSIQQPVSSRYEEATMTNSNASARVLQGLVFCAMLVASVLLAASSASAANLIVICPGGGPGAYPSITAALNAITNNAGPNSIAVSGTCTENILIRNQNDLSIYNATGNTAVIANAANPAQITVQLFGSHLVTFFGLTIQGGSPTGLFVNQGSDLSMVNSVIEKNVGSGATVLIKSNLNLNSCVIRNNDGFGILVGDSSVVVVMTPIQILNNNGPGAAAFSNGYIKFQGTGGHIIEGNAGGGIEADSDGHVFLQSDLPTVIRNNGGGGLVFVRGSTGRVDGQYTIENNGAVGVRVESSVVTFIGASAGSTITGHGFAGVDVSRGGELTFIGPHQITGNGNPTNGAGIRVERSSLSLQDGATVSNNIGSGILGDANSGIVLGPTASVTNNTSTGIRLRHKSLVGLTAPVTIQGNGGANIACDSTSLAYGQLAGITGVHCEE